MCARHLRVGLYQLFEHDVVCSLFFCSLMIDDVSFVLGRRENDDDENDEKKTKKTSVL